MDLPLIWSNLDQAAEWLSNETQNKWSREKIISFAIESYKDENSAIRKAHSAKVYEIVDGKRIYKTLPVFSKDNLSITHLPPSLTYLNVKFPNKPAAVSMYRYQADIKDPIPVSYEIIAGGLVRVFKSEIRFAPLYLKHLKEIFLDGRAEINQPMIEFIPKVGWEYTLFDPLKSLTPEEIKGLEIYSHSCHGCLPHDAIAELGGVYPITIDMLGITKENLEKLLSDYKTACHSTEEINLASESHTTHEMEILGEAIQEFWENHDTDRPPKKELVVAWLINKGVSKRIAESMDTIMRTPKARIGGNKPRTPKI